MPAGPLYSGCGYQLHFPLIGLMLSMGSTLPMGDSFLGSHENTDHVTSLCLLLSSTALSEPCVEGREWAIEEEIAVT